MIKRILFDVDNTLIKWEDSYKELSLKEAGVLDSSLARKLDDATKSYEEHISMLSRETFIDYIFSLNIDVDIDTINKMIDADKNRANPSSPEIISLFEYLSSKYELVIVTNWFSDVQLARLEKANLRKYFKAIYASDHYPSKPNKEIFLNAIEGLDPSECLMIGDSIKTDIIPAYNLGINVIFKNNNNEETEYRQIKDLIELKEML